MENKTNKKTILVTGGAGFIGSHLCEHLAKNGYKVISLDNYFTGKKENHIEGVDYREGHTKDIKKHITETPDIIYHLGEYSRVAKSIEEPNLVWSLNMEGTFGVLEFWREKKCKLIYAGSSTKFADPRDEGTEGKNLSPYTWAKSANTELVKNYGTWYNLPYAITYFYNVYGPRELSGKYGTYVEILRQKYLNNEVFEVRMPGTQKRNYTHIKDTISGLLLLGEKGQGDEYGIGAEESYETLELAKLFNHKIKMLPERKTSRPSAKVNTQKIKELGWKQKYTLEEYIDNIIKSKNNA